MDTGGGIALVILTSRSVRGIDKFFVKHIKIIMDDFRFNVGMILRSNLVIFISIDDLGCSCRRDFFYACT